MFVLDPAGNAPECETFADDAVVFARLQARARAVGSLSMIVGAGPSAPWPSHSRTAVLA
jgi:hypothetical protein